MSDSEVEEIQYTKMEVLEELLADACGDGKFETVEYLVKCKDVNINNPFYPLHKAVAYDEFPIIKFLVENGAGVNKKDCNGDYAMQGTWNRDIQLYLIEHGANILTGLNINDKDMLDQIEEYARELFIDKYKK